MERGERRSTGLHTLPGLMQQDEAEANNLCRIPHAAVTSQILEDIAPLTTWCQRDNRIWHLRFQSREVSHKAPRVASVCMSENILGHGGSTWAAQKLTQSTSLHFGCVSGTKRVHNLLSAF